MKFSKILAVVLGVLAGSVSVRAETDYEAMAVIRSIQKGSDNGHQIDVLRVRTDAVLPTGSIGAAELAASSVASSEIVDGSIVAADIATNVVGSSIVTDGSLADVDIAMNAAIAGSKLNLGGLTTNLSLDMSAVTNLTLVTADGVITSITVQP